MYKSTDVTLFFKYTVSSFSVEKWNTRSRCLLDFISDLIVGFKYFAEKYINDNIGTAIQPQNKIYCYLLFILYYHIEIISILLVEQLLLVYISFIFSLGRL